MADICGGSWRPKYRSAQVLLQIGTMSLGRRSGPYHGSTCNPQVYSNVMMAHNSNRCSPTREQARAYCGLSLTTTCARAALTHRHWVHSESPKDDVTISVNVWTQPPHHGFEGCNMQRDRHVHTSAHCHQIVHMRHYQKFTCLPVAITIRRRSHCVSMQTT